MTTTTPTQLPDVTRINEKGAFASSLPDAKQRYLAQVIANALSLGRRTAKDFVRHFPPRAIMAALADQPRLRANIVVPAIGTHEKVALKKSAESTGEDLEIALAEGVTDAESIVALFEPDDRVRYLGAKKLWAFVVEGDFWKAPSAAGSDAAVARQHVAFILDCAKDNGLLSGHDFVEACTLDRLMDVLPKADLAKVLGAALVGGRAGRVFDDDAFLAVEPFAALLEHLPLEYVWDRVVAPKIVAALDLADRVGPGLQSRAPVPPLPSFEEEDDAILIEIERASDPDVQQRGRRTAKGGT